MASLLDTALRYDLTLDIGTGSVEVNWYDLTRSETHTFREHVNFRHERRAALKRCIDNAVKKAVQVKEGHP